MSLLDYHSFFLVGIKGVAMTSMAQLLVDAGKSVQGSDVKAEFVTQRQLDRLDIELHKLTDPLPAKIDCIIYTAAHGGETQFQVEEAKSKNLPVYSHAAALGEFFNQKQGIAVCGVGGKSTISAMITWILEKNHFHPSYAVGVGEIIGLSRAAQWRPESRWMVAEADEYAVNPSQIKHGQKLIPRFSYLKPQVTVCSQIMFDHPDVYHDEKHTHQIFSEFFQQIKPGGTLIMHQSAAMLGLDHSAEKLLTYGSLPTCQAVVGLNEHQSHRQAVGTITINNQSYPVSLTIPGKYNLENAAAAVLATLQVGIDPARAIASLANFRSTTRRFEFKGEKNGVLFYDDYAHHPMEIAAVLAALKESFADKRVVVAFQPHTFSRTKELFNQFVITLARAPELVLLDIFASARENNHGEITSDHLVKAIQQHNSQLQVSNLHSISNLATYCQSTLSADDLLITLGAGDIYQVHDII